MRLPAAAAALAVSAACMVAVAVSAAVSVAVAQDAAQHEARWGPLAEGLGTGSGICVDGESIVCALVLCEDGATTLGVLDTGRGGDAGGEQPAFRGRIEVDGQSFEGDMQSRMVMQDFLHVRTPVRPGNPLWQRLRAGNRLALSSSPDGEPVDYSLRGSAAELDRVAAACR
jgi:hypothetical protein